MDVGADPNTSSQARQPVPDSSEREARRLRVGAPSTKCPVCGEQGELAATGSQVIPRLSAWPTHVTFYQCPNGHTWQFPPR